MPRKQNTCQNAEKSNRNVEWLRYKRNDFPEIGDELESKINWGT